MEKEEKVKKDMSDVYVEQISNLLNEIDFLKKSMLSDNSAVLYWRERLHALFMRLSSKMNADEKKKELEFHVKAMKVSPFVQRNDSVLSIRMKTYLIPEHLAMLKSILEEREMHLYEVMERVGLTNVLVEKKRRLW